MEFSCCPTGCGAGGGGILIDGAGPLATGIEHGDGYGAGGGSDVNCAERTFTGHDGVVILDLI